MSDGARGGNILLIPENTEEWNSNSSPAANRHPERTPALGTPVDDLAQLTALEPGTSVRVSGRIGPGLALRNEDGSWSATGISTPLCDEELWEYFGSITVLSRPRMMEGECA